MFSYFARTLVMSRAAVVIQNLLEHYGAGVVSTGQASSLANKLVQSVYTDVPEMFDGKVRKRPHRLSLAAIAVAGGLEDERYPVEMRTVLRLSLGSVLLEITGNSERHALTAVDWRLLDAAQLCYLQEAA